MQRDDHDDDKVPVTDPPYRDKAKDHAAETALNGRIFTVDREGEYCRPCGWPLTDDRAKFNADHVGQIDVCGECWRATLERNLGIVGKPDGTLHCHGRAGERRGFWIC